MEYKALNLGCGHGKIAEALNVDIDPNVNPDYVLDITKPWPFDPVEVIYMFHTIEHIPKIAHDFIFKQCHKLLYPSRGKLYLSYPEFIKCVENWKINYKGQREFWEATIYGRGLTPHDRHVCIMDSPEVTQRLINNGFVILKKFSEPGQEFNTVIIAEATEIITYEESLRRLYE